MVELFAASWEWVAYGAAACVAGLLIKIPVAGVVYVSMGSAPQGLRSAAMGVVSALAELGTAVALLLAVAPDALPMRDLVAFALAAGCIENMVLYAAALLSRPAEAAVEAWRAGARASLLVRHTFLAERAIALLGHLGSRGLVALVFATGEGWWLLLLALATFSAVDGLAALGRERNWNWSDPRLLRRFFASLLTINGVELAAFAVAAALLY
jgi:hypothetical protein